ncbi:MAG: GNA1162 family protein [Candidatus Cryptobacteroides sp.]
MKMKLLPYVIAVTVMLSSCGTASQITREVRYSQMYEENPVTLLVMPPINNTTNVDAKEYLYTSISRPLAEAGYYVISPLLALDILKAESAYDSELFVSASLTPFRNYFGADAVVFSEINSWTKTGLGIETSIRYFIRSAHTGEILFDRSCDLYLDLHQNSGSSNIFAQLLDLAIDAIITASTDHIVAARKANYYIFRDLPRGKYSPEHMQDKDVPSEAKDVRVTLR